MYCAIHKILRIRNLFFFDEAGRAQHVPTTRLSNFESGQRKYRQNDRRDICSRDYLRFFPSQKLEMMVDRGHSENSSALAIFLARVFEITGLQNHRDRFEKEYSSNYRQYKFFFAEHHQHSHRTAKRE